MTNKADSKTTARDFVVFKSACEEWLDYFSLREWRVFYEHGDSDSFAWCSSDHDGRCATLGLSTNWKHVQPTAVSVRRSALHEVLHLLICDISYLVNSRVCTDAILETAQHAIIRRLEHVILSVNR